jgi:hypothetical protein
MGRALNPFEIKAEVLRVIEGKSPEVLDAQEDKELIVRLLVKEFNNPKTVNADMVRDLLERYEYERYVDPLEIAEKDTQRLLHAALANPEVQIDFLDFIGSLNLDDQISLLQSLETEHTGDELANILIPVFLSQPNSETGRYALEMLGETKSQLAFAALKDIPEAKRAVAALKIAGVREDNTVEFYKNMLAGSTPYRFCITYPDGTGAQAVIFTRLKPENRAQFAAVVIDDTSVLDCFGFNDISKFEADAIIERFYRGEQVVEVPPGVLKWFLQQAEQNMPYEYICWRNILADIEVTAPQKQAVHSCLDFIDKWFLEGDWPLDANADFDAQVEQMLTRLDKKLWLGRLEKAEYLGAVIDKQDFLQNIVRRSIYEYYMRLGDAAMIAKVEEKWVE